MTWAKKHHKVHTYDLGSGLGGLEVIVKEEDLEVSCMGVLKWPLRGEPHVELAVPVLQGVDRHNAQDCLGRRIPKENIHKADHLDGLSQAHAVGKDAAKAHTVLVPRNGLHQVVIQEPNTTNLQKSKVTLCVQQ